MSRHKNRSPTKLKKWIQSMLFCKSPVVLVTSSRCELFDLQTACNAGIRARAMIGIPNYKLGNVKRLLEKNSSNCSHYSGVLILAIRIVALETGEIIVFVTLIWLLFCSPVIGHIIAYWMIWGVMSAEVLSELHFIPKNHCEC